MIGLGHVARLVDAEHVEAQRLARARATWERAWDARKRWPGRYRTAWLDYMRARTRHTNARVLRINAQL